MCRSATWEAVQAVSGGNRGQSVSETQSQRSIRGQGMVKTLVSLVIAQARVDWVGDIMMSVCDYIIVVLSARRI
jgi:hypothetical protein